MEYIQLTQENLQKEHICCSMTEKKGDHSVTDKKAWLKERMEEGLVFYKADVRGRFLLNIYRLKPHGSLFRQTTGCTSTVCGFPEALRAAAIPMSCWSTALQMPKRRECMVLRFYQGKRSCPI